MARHKKAKIQHQEPPVQIQEPPIESPGDCLARIDEEMAAMAKKRERLAARLREEEAEAQRARDEAEHQARCFWPEGKAAPTYHVKLRRQFHPCPACGRVLLDSGSQAVVCTCSPGEVAWLKCRACDHRWKLPACEPPEIHSVGQA